MAIYTQCKIGGVDVIIDPDTVNSSTSTYKRAVPSLDGTVFLHYVSSNPANMNFRRDINIQGVYLPTDAVESLQQLASEGAVISVTGVPGVDAAEAFLITNMTQNPIKPAVLFPGDDEQNPTVRHTYSVSLQRVSN